MSYWRAYSRRRMAFRIALRDGILYAELVGRETVAQTLGVPEGAGGTLARQRNASLQSFADAASALAWLQAGDTPNPESQSQEKR